MSAVATVKPKFFEDLTPSSLEVSMMNRKRRYQAYSPKDPKVGFIYGNYTMLTTAVQKALPEILRQGQGSPQFIAERIELEIEKEADEVCGLLKKDPTRSVVMFGIRSEDSIKLVKLTKEIAKRAFKQPNLDIQNNPQKFPSPENSVKLLNELYSSLGMKRSQEPVSFTRKDFETFKIEPNEAKADPTRLPCLAYALLLTGEVRAKEMIFIHEGDDQSLRGIFPLLERWQYTNVTEPKPNDLVVYLNQKDGVEHVGVYVGDGKVQSKIGFMNPHSHTHRIFDLNESKALFFRKMELNEAVLSEAKKD